MRPKFPETLLHNALRESARRQGAGRYSFVAIEEEQEKVISTPTPPHVEKKGTP